MGTTYTAKELRKLAEKQGFILKNQKGSHVFYENEDGRKTTIPMHKGNMHPKTANSILKDIGIKGGK